jgi:hypothetical protein
MRQCAAHGTSGSEAVRSRVEPRLEDRLHDLLHSSLDRTIFHGWDTQRPEDTRFSGFRDQNSAHRVRLELTAPNFLADCDKIFFRSLLQDCLHRDPVYACRTGTAIALHASKGDSKISWVCNKTPQFIEPIVRMISTLRIQLALHALEPQTIVCGCGIHRLPQRPRRCTHRLSPFAMYAAFPRADYYEDSAPVPRHYRAWRLARYFLIRRSTTGSRVHKEDLKCFRWQALPLAVLVAFDSGQEHGAADYVRCTRWAEVSRPVHAASPLIVVRSPYRGFQRSLQRARH